MAMHGDGLRPVILVIEYKNKKSNG